MSATLERSPHARGPLEAMREWLGRKLEAERDLLTVAEAAAAAFDAYEMTQHYCQSHESMDELHDKMGALGYALAEYAAKHRRA